MFNFNEINFKPVHIEQKSRGRYGDEKAIYIARNGKDCKLRTIILTPALVKELGWSEGTRVSLCASGSLCQFRGN